ncbi:MAG: Npt1/Npt2 family nucleotide transporter, partial [candidate division Zixibacteria bacterium]
LMLANIVLIMITYYFLKPARDALFLTKLSSAQVPLVFILTALVSAPVVTLYSKASRALRLPQLINVTQIMIIACLIGFYFLIKMEGAWIPYAFYVWVSIYGALTASQFWLLANGVFTATQAKRLFPFLGLGAIMGAWIGGELTRAILTEFKTRGYGLENLLWFCVVFLGISVILTNTVRKWRQKELAELQTKSKRGGQASESILAVFRSISKSRHLLLIVSVISLTMMVASFVDFQFKAIASSIYTTEQELGAFMGVFYGRLSLASMFLQIFFSYAILRKLGVGGIILFLPIGLLLGSATMFLAAGLTAAVLLRGADGAIKYSLDKTGRELLFLPVPLDLKKKSKVFIDLFVDRWFRGVAGGLLLLCIYLFGFDEANPLESMPYFSAVVIALVAVWIVLALIMRKEYVNTFRRALERRTIDPAEIRINIEDSSTRAILTKSLSAANPREIAYSLEMLVSTSDSSLTVQVLPLLDHTDSDIRLKAINVLKSCGDKSLVPRISSCLDDSDPDVRREAFYFMYMHAEDSAALVREYLASDDPKKLTAAITCVARYGTGTEKDSIAVSTIDALLEKHGQSEEIRTQVASSLAGLGRDQFRDLLKRLLKDKAPAVIRAAMSACGQLKDREHVPYLIRQLASQDVRPAARSALAEFGVGILGTLKDHLIDRTIDATVRRHIPSVLASIPDQQTVNLLASVLRPGDTPESTMLIEPRLRFSVVKALNGLRVRHSELHFEDGIVDKVLVSETRDYYEILNVLHLHKMSTSDPATELLQKALRERQEQNMERIFRLLGLSYPPEDIYSAYLGVISDKQSQKDSAVEFLDNLLSGDMKKYLIPIIDEISTEATVKRGRELFGTKLGSWEEALIFLMEGRDSWLRALAIYAAGKNPSEKLRQQIERAAADPDPVVRETAALILKN